MTPHTTDYHTLIHHAAAAGDIATLRACLEAGVPIDLPDADQDSPLCHAILGHQEEAVRFLLAAGAPVNQQRDQPLHRAADWSTVGVVRALLEAGADTEELSHITEETPLYWAAESGKADVVPCCSNTGPRSTPTPSTGPSSTACRRVPRRGIPRSCACCSRQGRASTLSPKRR